MQEDVVRLRYLMQLVDTAITDDSDEDTRRVLEQLESELQLIDARVLPWAAISHQLKGCTNILPDHSILVQLKDILSSWLPASASSSSCSSFGSMLQSYDHEVDAARPEDAPGGSDFYLNCFERKPYQSRDSEQGGQFWNDPVNKPGGRISSTKFRGQRKLLLMELEFLASCSVPGDIVVYIGAAPGHHIPLLSKYLFPELIFVLFDPAPFAFDDEGQDMKNVTIINDFFNWSYLNVLKTIKYRILFISDIRRIQNDEETISEDMRNQALWHMSLNPKASLLKFRLGWYPGVSLYLSGDLLLQPYAPLRSTETRLFIQRPDRGEKHHFRVYDNIEYMERCYFFNTEYRFKDSGASPGGRRQMHWDEKRESQIMTNLLKRYTERPLEQPNILEAFSTGEKTAWVVSFQSCVDKLFSSFCNMAVDFIPKTYHSRVDLLGLLKEVSSRDFREINLKYQNELFLDTLTAVGLLSVRPSCRTKKRVRFAENYSDIEESTISSTTSAVGWIQVSSPSVSDDFHCTTSTSTSGCFDF